MTEGYLCLVLHAHLPFVRHPEFDDFLEEDWLYEAITETYIPLLETLQLLERDGCNFRITMSISPTLAAMLADGLLQQRYIDHLDNLIELSAKEIERTRWLPEFRAVARLYHERFSRCRQVFVNEYGGNLLQGLRHHDDRGGLELITCAATHGLLPLITNSQARWGQMELGCREFQRHFGRRPRGIWLPECGFEPGLDLDARDAGLDYFFVETHSILCAEPRPPFGVYSPLLCARSGVAALGRDAESGKQVWSAVEGYPSDPVYREFYRDIGFDLEYEYLKPHLHRAGQRTQTGIKYYRITGATDQKEVYQPELARQRVREHARDFVLKRQYQARWLRNELQGRPPLIVAPYDAELFGHWWYEGPIWVEEVFRQLATTQELSACAVPEYLERFADNIPVGEPAAGTWGLHGYHEVWLDKSNDWIYPHLMEAANRMVEIARRWPHAKGLTLRALNQAARELLLAQSSDWAFIMKTGTMVGYAVERTKTHLLNFHQIYLQLQADQVEEPWLRELEFRHNCFPTIDYRLFA